MIPPEELPTSVRESKEVELAVEESMTSRREFIGKGALALGAAVVVACGRKEDIEPHAISFRQDRFVSTGGLIEASIEAGAAWVDLGDTRALLYSFNGIVPGPVIEARAGDTIRLLFRNSLPEPANLHYHGMHVPPTGRADNVFLTVPPGESQLYEFSIPADHPAGMFWYHPHLHGSVARQVSRGLAGVFLVRGELDQIPEIAAAREHFMVLQDFNPDRDGRIQEPYMMDGMRGREGWLMTVNGRRQPAFAMEQDGLTRLRILNASASRFYRLRLDEHPLHIIGTDGGGIAAPQTQEELLIAPGQRYDALVRGNRSGGSFRLLNLPYDRGSMGMMGGGGMMGGSGGPSSIGAEADVLATFHYEGRAGRIWEIPQRLLSFPAITAMGLPVRTFKLGMGMMGMGGMASFINGEGFDANRIDTHVTLGSVEEWLYVNETMMDHPMHLHTNLFQVLEPGGTPERAWRDILLVKANSTGRFRVQFRDFTGKAVQHCHILDHEDLGMMATVLVE